MSDCNFCYSVTSAEKTGISKHSREKQRLLRTINETPGEYRDSSGLLKASDMLFSSDYRRSSRA